jgi:hypothetical protein
VSSETVMVRISKRTHARLRAYQAELLDAALVGRIKGLEAEDWQVKGAWVSLDQVITRLLDLEDNHKERSRRAGARRRQKRRGSGHP